MPKINHKFHENEKVLCYHGPLLYEAKVQKSQEKENKETKEKTVHYFVHYLGWSKNWDEWVPEDRVLKINDISLQKQRELTDAQNKSNKNKSVKKKPIDPKDKETPSKTVITSENVKPKPANTIPIETNVLTPQSKDNLNVVKDTDGQRKKRLKIESNQDLEDVISNKGPDFEIKLSDLLKQSLIDDWELIGQKKLVRLPAKVSVNKIIDDYIKQKLIQKLSLSKENLVKEVAEAIKCYFNATIGTQLLYSFEKNQFKDLMKDSDDDSKASTLYGGIHLLRLFVKLGSLLAYLNFDDRSIQLISEYIHDFLKYLDRNPSLFSTNEYETASSDYLKKSL
ncbi:mortality factor 4-like protein 1 [Oppia nitens]|uniref:mortality factor 4-like protein 1 n=1 Tax=Oppia nitens TaxID=1686743 RepID=UPI0023DBC3AC|nr:mortality factor 4-like protein 1 [Oppia nitens]